MDRSRIQELEGGKGMERLEGQKKEAHSEPRPTKDLAYPRRRRSRDQTRNVAENKGLERCGFVPFPILVERKSATKNCIKTRNEPTMSFRIKESFQAASEAQEARRHRLWRGL
jgi:hypothetical protein